jgi:hypothetical protein
MSQLTWSEHWWRRGRARGIAPPAPIDAAKPGTHQIRGDALTVGFWVRNTAATPASPRILTLARDSGSLYPQ